MQFQPGQSGTPAGRPPGSRNRKTIAMEAAFQADLDAVVERIRQRAMDGQAPAMKLVMDRALPTGSGRPLALELPAIRTAEDVDAAHARIIAALAEGELSTREATDLMVIVERMLRNAAAKRRLDPAAPAPAAQPTASSLIEAPVEGAPPADGQPATPTGAL